MENELPLSSAAIDCDAGSRRPRFTGVRLFTDNDEALQAKRHLIAKAQRTLDLAYFIFEVDATSSRLVLDLIAAAARGVKVRLLMDYFLTFEQAPALRALGDVANIEVRRFGPPSPGWLFALQAAGIDRDAFIRALMAADGAKLAESLKGNLIFAPPVAAEVRALIPEPGESAINFPLQVLSTFQAGAVTAQAAPASFSGGAGIDRAAALRKVALVIEIIRGLKHYLHRTHHKLLLADGEWFVMGGRNLADAYQTQTPAVGRAFQDTDLLARDGGDGRSAHGATFQKLWESAQAVDIAQPDLLDSRPALDLDVFRQKAAPAPQGASASTFELGAALPDMDGQLFDNLPGGKGDTAITAAYTEQIQQLIARGGPAVIDVVSAYVALVDDAADSPSLLALRNAFAAAARAGITVNIYTNSIASTDLKPVNQAAYPKLIELIEGGVNVFELADGQGSLHTKCAAIGDACLVVGSYNMDPRSELYDTNNLIVLHDPSGAAPATFREERVLGLRWVRLTADDARRLAAEVKPSPGAGFAFGLL